MRYQIKTNGCVKGYGYVVDYTGNIWYYGSLDDCNKLIDELEAVYDED